MSEPTIQFGRDGAVATLTINNPAKRNALRTDMWPLIVRHVAEIEADPNIRVAVIRGAGDRAFAAGADLSQGEDQAQPKVMQPTYMDAVRALARMSKPLVADVRGYCMGGGVALAIQADFRIASADAVFGVPAAQLGRAYGFELVARLLALVGDAQTRRLLLVGERVAARSALQIGLVDEIAPDGESDRVVASLCERLAANAPLSVLGMKRIISEVHAHPGGTETESARAAVAACLESNDIEEGRRAFLERRKPRFTGT